MNNNNVSLKMLVKQSKHQVEKMNKKSLVDLISGNTEFEELLLSSTDEQDKVSNLHKKLAEMEENIIAALVTENNKLTEKVNEMEAVNSSLVKRIVRLETDHWETNQYNRRTNIEIAGIPENVSKEQLEDKVIDILKSIEVNCDRVDIEACHRLKKSENEKKRDLTQRTIVRFVSRKTCEDVFFKRKKLKDTDKTLLGFESSTKIYVNDNLCPYYRGIFGKLNYLKKLGKVHSCWSWFGALKFKFSESGAIFEAKHDNMLYDRFPDVDFGMSRS